MNFLNSGKARGLSSEGPKGHVRVSMNDHPYTANLIPVLVIQSCVDSFHSLSHSTGATYDAGILGYWSADVDTIHDWEIPLSWPGHL